MMRNKLYNIRCGMTLKTPEFQVPDRRCGFCLHLWNAHAMHSRSGYVASYDCALCDCSVQRLEYES